MFNTWSNTYPYCYKSISRDSVAPARPPEASSTQLPPLGREELPEGILNIFLRPTVQQGFCFFDSSGVFSYFYGISPGCDHPGVRVTTLTTLNTDYIISQIVVFQYPHLSPGAPPAPVRLSGQKIFEEKFSPFQWTGRWKLATFL